MKTIVQSPKTETVEYLTYFLTKSENLITLKKKYTEEQVPILLREKIKKPYGPILFKRIGHKSKTLNGAVRDIVDNGFTFISNETFDGVHEEEQKIFVRTDNVLGWIPFFPSPSAQEMDPYENHICKETEEYFVFLANAKKLFEKCTKETHKATLILRHQGNRREIIDCKIIRVNESNVEVEQYCFAVYENGNRISTTLGKIHKVILFVGPEFYLQKSTATFGVQHTISPYDDGKTPEDN